jgi:hypothetical protein
VAGTVPAPVVDKSSAAKEAAVAAAQAVPVVDNVGEGGGTPSSDSKMWQ